MPVGLNTTFQFLTLTRNDMADEVLLAALDSPHAQIRDLAFRAVLERRSPVGHLEIFRRLPHLDEHCQAIVGERPDRLARVVADAIQGGDAQQCDEACQAILAFHLYEAAPVLTAVLCSEDTPHRPKVAQTLLSLTELYYGKLCQPDEQFRKRNSDTLRKRITSALEEATGKFTKHHCPEVVEAFLVIAKQQNVVLRRMLHHAEESCHAPLMERLAGSPRGGVLRLLLSFLEDPQMPQAARSVIANRSDAKFVENFLSLVGPNAPKNLAETLSRFEGFAWAQPGHPTWAALSEEGQARAVTLLAATAMKRKALQEVIVYLLSEGKTAGRRAAAEAIRHFHGPEADMAIVKAINDEDPVVRSQVLRELRPRNIPQAMSLLTRMVDSPHEVVLQGLQEALPEFTFRHFMLHFDQMSEDLVVTAGHLVRKIDAEAPRKLQSEMECLSPVRRRRAILAASAMGVISELEEAAIKLLSDDDHMVRVAAAKALADCESMPSWDALRDALLDRSVVVQEAAEQSLLRIVQSLKPETEPEVEEVLP